MLNGSGPEIHILPRPSMSWYLTVAIIFLVLLLEEPVSLKSHPKNDAIIQNF